MVVAPDPTQQSVVTDEHSLLLWQACAYADELTDDVRQGRSFAASYDALVEFLHHRLLPYLDDEERRLPPGQLRDDHLATLIRTEHARLRADVDNIEGSRTRGVLALSAESLVDRLERHVHREEAWVTGVGHLRIERHERSEANERSERTELTNPDGTATRGSAWV
jgi:hypothetical protein